MNKLNVSINPIRSALYYPYPFIYDENWLKIAALFWDKIYRIVPHNFNHIVRNMEIVKGPTKTERIFSEEFNFINELTSFDIYFRKPTDGLYRHLELLNQKKRNKYLKEYTNYNGEYFSWGTLETEKLSCFFIEELLKKGIIIKDNLGNILIRKYPGMLYMALLAHYISCDYSLPIVTDDIEHDDLIKRSFTFAINQLSSEIFPPLRREFLKSILCSLTFKAIGICDISNIKPRKIILFRKHYDDERIEYFNEIDSIVKSISKEEIKNSGSLPFTVGK